MRWSTTPTSTFLEAKSVRCLSLTTGIAVTSPRPDKETRPVDLALDMEPTRMERTGQRLCRMSHLRYSQPSTPSLPRHCSQTRFLTL